MKSTIKTKSQISIIKKPLPAVQVIKLTKEFPNGVIANINNDLTINYGEIHVLFGENGAGKSTLIKMLSGIEQPTSGSIYINGDKTDFNFSSAIANDLGIGVVHQHFSLINDFTVFENVVLGYEWKSSKQRELNNQKYQIQKTALLKSHQQQINQYRKQVEIISDQHKQKIKKLNEQKLTKTQFENHQQELLTFQKKALSKYDLKLLHQQQTNQLQKIFLKNKQKNFATFYNTRELRIEIEKIIKKFHLNLKLNARIRNISLAEKQKTEILKILFRKCNIIIFDEPTSVLKAKQIDGFLKSLLFYKKQNKAVVFITHKVNEIRAVADKISVMRRGEMLGTFKINDITNKKLINLMVGHELGIFTNNDLKTNNHPKILEVKNLNLLLKENHVLKNIQFSLNVGEIVGLAGIENNGQTELLQTLFGFWKPTTGSILYYPKALEHKTPKPPIVLNKLKPLAHQKYKIAYLSDDRMGQNVLKHEPIYINVIFNDLNNPDVFKNFFVNKTKAIAQTKKIVNKYHVLGMSSPEQPINSLSGGNIQKLLIGREMEKKPDLILIDKPTWGVDVGAKSTMYDLMIQAKQQQKTILFASSNLEEIIQISDRILVISKGEIVGTLINQSNKAKIYQQIGELMSGVIE